jgi:hypothetical protein
MKVRCYNPNDKDYKFYGGRGIKIYDEWMGYPTSFINWALANGYYENASIDRIDINKGYSPANCRWISFYENSARSKAKILEYNGLKMCMRDWSRYLYGDKWLVRDRLKHGWSVERTLTEPRNLHMSRNALGKKTTTERESKQYD